MSLQNHLRPSVTADAVIFTLRRGSLSVLLVERKFPPFEGTWALPGGFVGIDEPLGEAAARELEEEAGLRGIHLEQLGAFGHPGRDPRGRVITVAYVGLLAPDQAELRAGSDAARASWWPLGDLPPLAFDHADILDCALRRLRCEVRCGRLPAELLPQAFELSALQNVCEVILGEPLDTRRFQCHVLSAGAVTETGEAHSEQGGVVKLYRLRERNPCGLG